MLIKSKLLPVLSVVVALMMNANVQASDPPDKASSNQKSRVDELFDAVDNKDLKKVKALISQGLSPDAKNSNDESILEAMMRVDGYIPDRKKIVNYLIKQGAKINYVDSFGLTLLHITALADMFSTVELLLDRKIDYTAKTGFGKTALFYTSNPKMIELLINRKAGTMQDVDDDGDTLLHNAGGLKPKLELIKYLIKHIDINIKNKDGNTVLIETLNSGYFPEDVKKVVDYLLSNGADVNLTGKYGRSAFIAAIRNRKLDLSVIETLIAAGADINQKDDKGRGAIHYTAASNFSYMKYLAKKGVDLNAVSEATSETPLQIAVQYNRKQAVKYLLDNNVDVNIKDNTGKTALNYAIEGDFSDIVLMLNEKNAKAGLQADIDEISQAELNKKLAEKKRKRNTVKSLKSAIRLHDLEATKKYYAEKINGPDAAKLNKHKLALYAIEKGTLPMLRYFFENGLDINSKDDDGYSLLHDAVFYNNIDIANFLIKSGLDVNYQSTDGSSIFSMNANSSREMVDFLIEQGIKIDKKKEKGIVASALYYRNPVMAEYFIKQGYPFDKKIFENEKYLLKLIQKQDIDTFRFLLKKGLNIETKVFIYGDKATLLHLAVMIEANKVVDFLLASGADPNARNTAGKPIFPDAINNGDLHVLNALYDHGANVNDIYKRREQTVLQTALELQRVNIIRMLVMRGADVNHAFGSGKNTALHIAAQKGYLDTLKMMVKKGGNINLLNRARKAPLDMAIKYEQKAVTAYLTELEKIIKQSVSD
ncbi:hypothetical protein MNBD_GAMMA09-726 [hydrothermal vent metagenome]|uniref:Uncharacterized protein n=1 Tax=hydrothermal vent metagenome TaxID=652676 RepID=A0A3B0XYT9_9ZZZZ